MIFLDYEQYYEARFGKPPRVVKKMDDKSVYEQLKKNALRQKQLNASINTSGTPKNPDQQQPPLPPSKPNFKKRESTPGSEKSEPKTEIEVQGASIGSKKKEDEEDLVDVRVLKGIPDYSDVP